MKAGPTSGAGSFIAHEDLRDAQAEMIGDGIAALGAGGFLLAAVQVAGMIYVKKKDGADDAVPDADRTPNPAAAGDGSMSVQTGRPHG